MNVLSLFDGMSCGQIALNRAGIKYQNYYASEIDKHAIKVTQHNYPNTKQLGSVTSLLNIDWSVQKIDLLIGGSPCQNFSFAGSQKGMVTSENVEVLSLDQYLELKNSGFEFQGQSFLFWEYVRILKEIQKVNPEVKFLLENVEMSPKWQNLISEVLGVKPISINSNLLSCQNRPRLYWTNINNGKIDQPKNKSIFIKDIKQINVDEKYFYKQDFVFVESKGIAGMLNINGHDILKRFHFDWQKVHTLTCCRGGNLQKKVLDGNRVRKLTPLEYERAQTVPDDYTNCVSDSQRYNLTGNGWTVDVIVHIFSYL